MGQLAELDGEVRKICDFSRRQNKTSRLSAPRSNLEPRRPGQLISTDSNRSIHQFAVHPTASTQQPFAMASTGVNVRSELFLAALGEPLAKHRPSAASPRRKPVLHSNHETRFLIRPFSGFAVVRPCRRCLLRILPPAHHHRHAKGRAQPARVREEAKIDRPGQGRIRQEEEPCPRQR